MVSRERIRQVMREIITALVIMMAFAATAFAQEVKYIDAPKFEGQIYLYGEPAKSDVEYEQWYEIQGRGQFVRNVRVPTLIPYLPDEKDLHREEHSFITLLAAEAMRQQNGSGVRVLRHLSSSTESRQPHETRRTIKHT